MLLCSGRLEGGGHGNESALPFEGSYERKSLALSVLTPLKQYQIAESTYIFMGKKSCAVAVSTRLIQRMSLMTKF